ncbi:MAG TPA: oxygen-independent coproporphyrinogen III oxidase [Thermoanaerobaculia bacterium]|nr:oxygen-independent coproporphyrinogen III oxidase [Thermoanaerobaculia bacterium]
MATTEPAATSSPTAADGGAADLWTPPPFARELIRKYDRPGPRYTSYPTAPSFRDDFGPEQYSRLLERSASRPAPLSLYVHVPFCETRCFFCGCNVTISRDKERGTRYLASLHEEMARVSERLCGDGRPVVQVHWGGGTPTFLLPEDILALGQAIRRDFVLSPELELGVEIDPRRCTSEQLDALAAIGVNRLSLGVQDLDPRVQAAVNRWQPLEVTERVIAEARRRGIGSVNVDLIYGLPHQTPQSFAATVRDVLALGPDRLAVFNFAYLPQMLPHQGVIDPAHLPTPEVKLTLLEEVIAVITAGGYVFIGMDHFARPQDPLALALRDRTLTRNFQGYSTWGGTELVGFGSSAIGQVGGGYAQNLKSVPAYQEALDRGIFATARGLALSAEDELRRDVILRLMCHFRVDKRGIEEAHGIDFDRHFAAEMARLAPLADDGLVRVEPDRLEVTPLGRLLVRNVAMEFDQYLQGVEVPAFSRTV